MNNERRNQAKRYTIILKKKLLRGVPLFYESN